MNKRSALARESTNYTVVTLRSAVILCPASFLKAMADGHVTWVSDTVNPTTYLAAFTRARGETQMPGDEF